MKRLVLLLCLTFICSNFFFFAKAQAVNTGDSLALVDLYNSTNGQRWENKGNWLSGPVPTWEGVTVTGTRVTQIVLENNNMNGPLPPSIGNLTELTVMDLITNRLSGALPSSIGNLVNLQYLNIAINRLSGSLPSTLGNLVNITDMYLSNNSITGNIPSSIGNLTKLVILVLRYNHLNGSIPSSIGNLTSLFSLYLDHNRLRGDVPASIHKLSQLAFLELSSNELTFSQNYTYPLPLIKGIDANLAYNRFTFDGIEFLSQRNSYYVTFSPQAPIPIHQNGNMLSVSAGGTLSNNVYQWFKAGDPNPRVIVGDSTFHPAESGSYYATITNAIVHNRLILTTDTIAYTASLTEDKTSSLLANKNVVASASNPFSVYPNPAKSVLHVVVNGTSAMVLTNGEGKVLLAKTMTDNGELDVSRLANGVYYLKNKTTGETQKIVILH